MIPSSKYTEDVSARQTLPNGAVLKWTRKAEDLFPLNQTTDLSIAYSNWNSLIVTRANKGFHQWQGGTSVGDSLGRNEQEGWEHYVASGIEQNVMGQPVMTGIYTGTVLANGGGLYVWGYNKARENPISSSGGKDRRFLLDMEVNKMIFNCSITAYYVSDFDEYEISYSDHPGSPNEPQQHTITLGELYENPDDYYVTSIVWHNTYVYNEDSAEHWDDVVIRPMNIFVNADVGEIYSGETCIFGLHYNSGHFSYQDTNPNNRPNFDGGGWTEVIFKNMADTYLMGTADEINMSPDDLYPGVGDEAVNVAVAYWGTDNSWSHTAYVGCKTFDYGDSVIWCAYGAGVTYDVELHEGTYRDYVFWCKKYVKGRTMLEYLASFGLYFSIELLNPNDYNLTPETLWSTDGKIMLGEMYPDGTTTGEWITDFDEYEGYNKDGKISNPDYTPDFPDPPTPTPTSQEGYHMKVILSDYAEKIKFKTPKRRTQI